MRKLVAVLFTGFELLDLAGPLEMFGSLSDEVEIVTTAETAGPVRSTQGVEVVAATPFSECPVPDFLLLPGGMGTFAQGRNPAMIEFLQRQAPAVSQVMTVCSGSALLARSGLLDGRRATTNKAFFSQCCAEGPAVDWVAEARWVEDGPYATSSGVSAGIDMALAIIARHFGKPVADRLALRTEYDWHQDPSWDPFARAHGLVT
jgi:transcriptional regulator GlxA family with amidase domain